MEKINPAQACTELMWLLLGEYDPGEITLEIDDLLNSEGHPISCCIRVAAETKKDYAALLLHDDQQWHCTYGACGQSSMLYRTMVDFLRANKFIR